MRKQTTYLVECSLPVLSDKHRLALQDALEDASRRLSASGSPVRYVGSTFVPARSRCFCLFEAASLDVVRAVTEAALVPHIAINEAIDFRATAVESNRGTSDETHAEGHRSGVRRRRSR